jgi:hypothetical protein
MKYSPIAMLLVCCFAISGAGAKAEMLKEA